MAKVSPSKKKSAMAKVEGRIVDIADADPYVKLLIYGRHGSGKTRLAATAPSILIVDVNEKGTRSARNIPGAKVFHVRRWEDIAHIYWYLKAGEHPYESVAIDTITGMQHLCMKHVLGEAEDRDPNREPSMPDRRTWGKLSELMKPMILDYRNLPLNVIFTAQERVMGDPEEGEPVMHAPDLSPGSRGIAMAAVDVIGRIYQKEERKVVGTGKKKKVAKKWVIKMLVGPHDEYETKDRTGALGRTVTAPTVPDIIEAAFSKEDDNE